jgi:cytidylate kinase
VIITIDGPAGSGKSTTASKLAKKLGFVHINQGAMFRAIGLKAANLGLDLGSDLELSRLAKETRFEFDFDKLLVDGVDASDNLLSVQAAELASRVAVLPELRQVLLEIQQDFSKTHSVVVEGRDAGSVGFPNAELKVYLDASIATRAKRRYGELLLKGALAEETLEDLMNQMLARDVRDSTRAVAPLVKPKDALILDTSDLTPEEIVEQLYKKAIQLSSE